MARRPRRSGYSEYQNYDPMPRPRRRWRAHWKFRWDLWVGLPLLAVVCIVAFQIARRSLPDFDPRPLFAIDLPPKLRRLAVLAVVLIAIVAAARILRDVCTRRRDGRP